VVVVDVSRSLRSIGGMLSWAIRLFAVYASVRAALRAEARSTRRAAEASCARRTQRTRLCEQFTLLLGRPFRNRFRAIDP
jgi:hypothetical protein